MRRPLPWLSAVVTAAAATSFACGGEDICVSGPFCFTPPTQATPSSIEAGPNAAAGLSGAPGRQLPKPLDVVVKDSDGKPVPGVSVSFSVASGGGQLSTETIESDVNGFAQVTWTLGSELGTQRVEARATKQDGAPLANSPLQLSAEAVPPQAARLALRTTLPETAENGVPLSQQPVIEVYDADDQPLSGVEVVASVSAGGATASGGTTARSDGEGLASFTNLSLVGPQGPQTLRFSVATPPLEVISTTPVQLLPGNAASMVANGPATYEGTVNSPVAPGPSVLVKDQAGNPAPGVTVSFAPNRNATVSPEEAITNEQGIAQVGWTLGTTANVSYTLTARIESSAIAPVRFTALARPGNAGRLRVAVQPSSSTPSGTAFATQPAIQLEDPNGNPTPQAGVTVTAAVSSGPSGTLANATATTDGSGRATFSGLALTGLVGNYTLSFSAAGLTGTTSSPFAITVGAAARLALLTQPSTLALSRALLVIQPVVQVQDASGNAVRQAGISVTASVTTPPATLANATAVTDENGVARFSGLSLTGIPGPRDVTFSAAPLQSTSARVTLLSVETVQATPTHPVSAVVGTTFTGPVLTWQLRDAATRPVPDADFTFRLPQGGTAAAPQFSDANGVVQITDWTLGPTAGYQYLVLRLPDGREFKDSILATPDVPASIVKASGDGQTAMAGQNLPQPLVARVLDRHGNGVSNVPVQWATCEGTAGPVVNTDPSGYSSVTQPTGDQAANGCTRASITLTDNSVVSVDFTYTVTASASQEPAGVSAARSQHSGGPPPVRLRPTR